MDGMDGSLADILVISCERQWGVWPCVSHAAIRVLLSSWGGTRMSYGGSGCVPCPVYTVLHVWFVACCGSIAIVIMSPRGDNTAHTIRVL